MAPASKPAKPRTTAKPVKNLKPVKSPVKPAAKPVVTPEVSPPPRANHVHALPKPTGVHHHHAATAPLLENFKKFAAENPALAVVGIIAVTLAFILLLD